MARSGKVASHRGRRLVYYIPLIALAAMAGVYIVVVSPYSSPAPAMQFDAQISIQIITQYPNGTWNNNLRFVIPPAIGVAGFSWYAHTYDSYGLDGHYPIYTDPPTSQYRGFTVIHVRSRMVHNYTLGDFFAVWGYPIGPDQTLNLVSQPNGPSWAMCVGPTATSQRPGQWGQEVLKTDMPITLRYDMVGCL